MAGVMGLLAVVGLVYVGIVALLYLLQTSLVFPGTYLPSHRLNSPRVPERLELPAGDGATLHGMLFPGARPDADLLIGFGGNAQDAEHLGQDLAADFPDLNVVVFHYRGYGPSTGRPSEAAVLADALMIYDFMVERLEPARVYAIGISLGSAVAAYLSQQRRLAGVLLVTPFDSVEAIAKETYFWVPVGLLLRHRFPSVEFMTGNPTPSAVIAAAEDRVVKPRRTEALIARLENLVFHATLEGAGHETLYELPAYKSTLQAAFRALREASEKGIELRPDQSSLAPMVQAEDRAAGALGDE
ncbi:MAG TPA: alpha/beta fold hydrolase [Geminicoccaceae bacterium]|nr:alpha/beta fold hydrolase [Geminicoccaceae bacterium]